MNILSSLLRVVLGRRTPTTDGEFRVEGTSETLTIRRDEWGIPHVRAENDADAWYGLGFCEGQDRRFQIEILVRLARGRLAEVIGERLLSTDRLSRRVGFYHRARQQIEALDEVSRRCLEAYVRGINEGTVAGRDRLPHPFTLLMIDPLTITPADVLALSAVVGLGLNSNWDAELARLKILQEDGAQAVKDLDPSYAEWLNVTHPPGREAGPPLDALSRELDRLTSLVGTAGGASNNWTLSGDRTATGRPLLANDPHLPPMHPPQWYLCHLETPEWGVAGASLVGLPGISCGHNGHAAWGPTACNVDMADFFLEEIGEDGRSVRRGDELVECGVRHETIPVRGAEPVEETVLVTDHGPVVSPALEDHGDVVLSMALTSAWPQRMRGYMELPRVRDFEAFRKGFEGWTVMSLDYVYADDSGDIGWQTVGQAPRRKSGYGTVPGPGWDPEVGWEEDPVPHDDMPRAKNPEAGYLATANNRPVRDSEEPFLGMDWIDGYRVTRIADRLEERDDWDVQSTLALQMDEYSLPWEELREDVLSALGEAPDLEEARRHLEAWDGVVDVGSTAAALFEFWLAEMINRVARAKAPNAAEWALGKSHDEMLGQSKFALRRVSHLVRLLRERPAGWFEAGWDETIRQAAREVLGRLRENHGEDPDEWAWGKLRPLTFEHPLGELPLLDGVYNLGPFPWGGDTNTVAQASPDPRDVTGNPIAVASLRMVVDVGNWDEARFALPGGQSGNPFSEHYDDMLPRWREGDGIPIAWSEEAVQEGTRDTLTLRPGAAAKSPGRPARAP